MSNVCKNFCANLDIKHLASSPFHLASSGEAKRFVQTFQLSLDKTVKGEKNLLMLFVLCWQLTVVLRTLS